MALPVFKDFPSEEFHSFSHNLDVEDIRPSELGAFILQLLAEKGHFHIKLSGETIKIFTSEV